MTGNAWIGLGILALLIAPPAGGSAEAREKPGDGVKVLLGFEVPEIVGEKSQDPTARDWLFVGRQWTAGEPEPGWRVRQNVDQLRLPAGHDGPVTIYRPDGSRDRPLITLDPTGATQGKHARKWTPRTWRYIKGCAEGKALGLMAQPAEKSYHDVQDWFWQREANIFDDALEHRYAQRDWSGYEYLRVDVLSQGAPAVLAMRAFDSSGPRINAHYLGLRTALAVFRVPSDKQVTLNFRLGELARAGELDVSRMMGFTLRLNGYEGEATLFFDNIRLVARPASKPNAVYPLVEMEDPVGPYARPVIYRPVARQAEKTRRKAGPVEPVGPVTVYEGRSTYSSARMLLGGSGATYFQCLRRGCVAYDNDRLLIVFGNYQATASFDGGRTWGGLQPGEPGPVSLGWGGHYRGTTSGDRSDLYFLGTENCSSYHEGYGVLLRRLAMTGPGWTDDRVALVDQNLRKCPPDMRAWRLDTGRIWAAWTDGWGGSMAKSSDDDGYTWVPCKDASLPAPRPLHQPDLADLARPVEQRPQPPKAILPWPAEPVAGSVLLPYRESVAVLGYKGRWQLRGTSDWIEQPKMPWGVPYSGSATVLGTRIFLVRGARYSDTAKEPPSGALEAAIFHDGTWSTETLVPEGVGSAIATASGDAVFCFYVQRGKQNDAISCRRWTSGRWEEPRPVASGELPVNHLAAPIVSPPDYAAVWWDQWKTARSQSMRLRFARVPQ